MRRVSERAQRLLGQPMFKVLDRVQELERQGRDIVHFEIGDPDFDTPRNIIDAACDSLKSGETHYTSSMGLHDLRVAICNTTEISRKFRPDIEQVLVTPGANIAIYYAVRCLVDSGNDVILPDPYFPTYRSVIEFCGVNPIYVPLKEENGFRMNPGDIEDRITDKTQLIIVNSPHNPCGSVMTKDELDAVFNIAEKHNVYLLLDEIYSRLIYDKEAEFYSPAVRDRCKEFTVLTNGFSKAFAMTGWRIGGIIGPKDVIAKMGLLLQTTASCVPPFIQRAAIEAISGTQDEVRKMSNEFKARRDLMVDGLRELPGITCLKPGGALYVFPNIQGTGMDEETFARVMLEDAGVALLPGTNFGKAGAGYVRLCYATDSEHIAEGLTRMEKCLKESKF